VSHNFNTQDPLSWRRACQHVQQANHCVSGMVRECCDPTVIAPPGRIRRWFEGQCLSTSRVSTPGPHTLSLSLSLSRAFLSHQGCGPRGQTLATSTSSSRSILNTISTPVSCCSCSCGIPTFAQHLSAPLRHSETQPGETPQSPPHRPREDGLVYTEDTSSSNRAALGLRAAFHKPKVGERRQNWIGSWELRTACATVRGKPSRMKPHVSTSSCRSLCRSMESMVASGMSCPDAVSSFTCGR
jgi:hypothetical protein